MPKRYYKSLIVGNNKDKKVAIHGEHRSKKGRDPNYQKKKRYGWRKRMIEEKIQEEIIKEEIKKVL